MSSGNAQSLLASADKKASSGSGFFSFGSSTAKYEEAHDLYKGAANAFRLEGRMKESGDAFCKAAEMALKAQEKLDAGQRFYDASKSYKLSNPELAIMALQKYIKILLDDGKFRQAADRSKEIAQIYQADGNDQQSMQQALEAFEQSGEWYRMDDSSVAASAVFKEAADIAALLEKYQQAIKRYDEVAQQSLKSALTKYSVREYFLKATLCHLLLDVVGARQALDSYRHLEAGFEATREYKFLIQLTEAVEHRKLDDFTAVCTEYDAGSRMDNWKITMLTRLRQTLDAPEEGGLS